MSGSSDINLISPKPVVQKDWQGLPYYPINQYYKSFFGEKTYKIPVSVPGTCPNREGLNGMTVCNFCDEWGSAAYPESRAFSLLEQISKNRAPIQKRANAQKFLVYFQAYTFTYSRVVHLRKYFNEAVGLEDVSGIVLGTRPDCISDALLELWNEFAQSKPLFVEFGVQSFDNSQLEWMSRGHTAEKSIWALERLQKKCPEVNVGIHLMFGLPNESDEQVIEWAQKTNNLPVHNVKLHNLHVLKNTPLAEDYSRGEFAPIELDDYCRRVMLFLQHLKPSLPVHRLTAYSSRADELIAPKWTGDKMRSYQYVIDYLKANEAYQGQYYDSGNSH